MKAMPLFTFCFLHKLKQFMFKRGHVCLITHNANETGPNRAVNQCQLIVRKLQHSCLKQRAATRHHPLHLSNWVFYKFSMFAEIFELESLNVSKLHTAHSCLLCWLTLWSFTPPETRQEKIYYWWVQFCLEKVGYKTIWSMAAFVMNLVSIQ